MLRAERLAREGVAAEPDESEFFDLDPYDDEDFEALVADALDELPDLLRALVENHNVAVVISDGGRRRGAYGLYHGDGATPRRRARPDRDLPRHPAPRLRPRPGAAARAGHADGAPRARPPRRVRRARGCATSGCESPQSWCICVVKRHAGVRHDWGMAGESAIHHEIDAEMHTRPDRAIAALAARQHGVVSRAQLEAIGLGRGANPESPRAGLVASAAPGRLRRRSSPADGRRCLDGGGPRRRAGRRAEPPLCGSAVGHPQHGPRRRRGDRPRACRRPGIHAHRAILPPDEFTRQRGIPVTNPARTLLDLAEVLTPQQLERAINEAEIRRLASPLPLAALVARHPHRRGTNALRRILEQRKLGETVTRSVLEERFLALVDANGFPRPKMNEPLGPYHPDALWPDERLVVKLDSYPIHSPARPSRATASAIASSRSPATASSASPGASCVTSRRTSRTSSARCSPRLELRRPRSARRAPRRPRATRATRSAVP